MPRLLNCRADQVLHTRPLQVLNGGDADVPDIRSGAGKQMFWVWQSGAAKKPDVHILRVCGDMTECFLQAIRERVCGRDGIIGIVDEFRRLRSLFENDFPAGKKEARDHWFVGFEKPSKSCWWISHCFLSWPPHDFARSTAFIRRKRPWLGIYCSGRRANLRRFFRRVRVTVVLKRLPVVWPYQRDHFGRRLPVPE